MNRPQPVLYGNSYKAAPAPEHSARAAGLRYSLDDCAGIRRRRRRRSFVYVDATRRPVRDERTLKRIRALAIPPAWTAVWICPREDGHLQATGRDARGRKQYRYHARWREARDETKFGRVEAFVRALPRLRRRVSADLARSGLPREKVLAALARLLETTFIRVGNEEYARENESFGLTTLRSGQVSVRGARLRFRFRGKSGVEHRIDLSEPRLASLVRRMQELPGEELFQYVDESGETRAIESADVNDYLRDATGEAFTSKDFRTWAGTQLALEALRRTGETPTRAEAARRLNEAVDSVATALGNTRAVCRRCYIHPAVVEAFEAGEIERATRGARSPEKALIALLGFARRRRTPPQSLAARLSASVAVRRRRRICKAHSRGTLIAASRDAVSLNPG